MAKRHVSLQALSRQHHHGLALALRLQQGERALLNDGWTHDAAEQRRRVIQFHREELEEHFAAEEQVLFPLASKSAPRTGPLVRNLVEEHRHLEQLATALGETEPDRLPDLLRRFGAALEHHIRVEEREFFPLCEQELSAGELALLGPGIETALEQHRARRSRALHASARKVINAPSSQLFAAIADLDSYSTWWPGCSGTARADDAPRIGLSLPIGPFSLRFVLADLKEGKSVEFSPAHGAGYLRWSLMDYRGGRAVTIELNVDPPSGMSTEGVAGDDLRCEIAAGLAAVVESLEQTVTTR